MATLTKVRTAQPVQAAIFEFTITDTMVNTSGVETAFSAASGTVYDVIGLPINSQVVGGDITVEAVSTDTGTATLSVGDSSSATRYASAVDIKAAARTALTLTGFPNASGLPIRFTLANQNGNAGAGTVRVTVLYIVENRACEVTSK